MQYLSFGKLAIKPDQIDAFLSEAKDNGITTQHVQANIYDFGIKLPTLLDQETLRKKAGMIGLKYADI